LTLSFDQTQKSNPNFWLSIAHHLEFNRLRVNIRIEILHEVKEQLLPSTSPKISQPIESWKFFFGKNTNDCLSDYPLARRFSGQES
jgi:hypothetical protein